MHNSPLGLIVKKKIYTIQNVTTTTTNECSLHIGLVDNPFEFYINYYTGVPSEAKKMLFQCRAYWVQHFYFRCVLNLISSCTNAKIYRKANLKFLALNLYFIYTRVFAIVKFRAEHFLFYQHVPKNGSKWLYKFSLNDFQTAFPCILLNGNFNLFVQDETSLMYLFRWMVH